MRSKNKELMISIKKYIEEYALENGGKTPNVDQIGEFMKMTHVSAYRYLKAMDAEGMIQYERGKIRTELIDKLQPGNAFSAITGSIPCGPEDERYRSENRSGEECGRYTAVAVRHRRLGEEAKGNLCRNDRAFKKCRRLRCSKRRQSVNAGRLYQKV